MGMFLEWLARREILEANAQLGGGTVVGIGAKKIAEGIVLKIQTHDGRQGWTSPIESFNPIRQNDAEGRGYWSVRTANSSYIVAMEDNVAKIVVTAFHSPAVQAPIQQRAAERSGQIRGGKPGSAKFIMPNGAV